MHRVLGAWTKEQRKYCGTCTFSAHDPSNNYSGRTYPPKTTWACIVSRLVLIALVSVYTYVLLRIKNNRNAVRVWIVITCTFAIKGALFEALGHVLGPHMCLSRKPPVKNEAGTSRSSRKIKGMHPWIAAKLRNQLLRFVIRNAHHKTCSRSTMWTYPASCVLRGS